MLTPDQEDALLLSLFATAEAMGQELTEPAGLVMVQDLKDYEEPAIAAALQACRRELTGKLTIAAILQRVQAADGRPARDEAWSIALQAGDERDSVVLTGEILAALQVARPLLDARDKVGARMAFISAYDRLVDDARRAGQSVKWELSIGFDPQLRARAIEQARDLKRLPPPEAERLLLQHTLEAPTGNGQAIAGLLTGAAGAPDPATREKLQAIRKELKELDRRRLVQRRWDRRRAKREWRARKEAFIKRAAELQAQREETA